jgi:membrane-associated protein
MGEIINFILHTDDYLIDMVAQYGLYVYAILFLVIFAETGFVVTPFLPGDGFIFTVGVIAGTSAASGGLNIWIAILIMIIAAILGNVVNFHIGRFLSTKILEGRKIKWVNEKHLAQTHEFFEKHGQKAVILSRFLPIFRTFVPFVAGISKMNRLRFINYTLIGGISWVIIFGLAGYYFGRIQFVRDNLSAIVLGLIIVTLIPIIMTAFKQRAKNRAAQKS